MSSSNTPKTILLKGDPLAQENTGAGAILPGHLLERDNTGTVSVHSVPGGRATGMFAREEEYTGGSIDTAYAAGDRIPHYTGRNGDWFYAWLADDQNAVIGSLLESAGDGTLRLLTTDGHPVARAVQAVNTTGGSVATARIKVEVL